MFRDIHNLILKESGIDRVIEKVIHRMGMIENIYLTGEFARGNDSPVIELILIGAEIDREYLARKVNQAEDLAIFGHNNDIKMFNKHYICKT